MSSGEAPGAHLVGGRGSVLLAVIARAGLGRLEHQLPDAVDAHDLHGHLGTHIKQTKSKGYVLVSFRC